MQLENLHFGNNLTYWLQKLEISQAELARRMGRKHQQINALTKREKVDLDTIRLVASSLKITTDELLSINSKSDIFVNPQVDRVVSATDESIRDGHQLIPYYDIDITAGAETLFLDGPVMPSYYFDLPAFRGCQAYPMRGDSMMDAYNPGDILFIQEISYWRRWMVWNRVCVVVTSEERMVKVVDKGDQEGFWKLISINTAHRAFDIPVDEILKVFVVRGSVRQDSYVVQQRVILREEQYLNSQRDEK